MAIPLKDLIENPSLLGTEPYRLESIEDADGRQSFRMGNRYVKADEYYSKHGELIDQHPIVSARVRKG